jgi:hypothetical protein
MRRVQTWPGLGAFLSSSRGCSGYSGADMQARLLASGRRILWRATPAHPPPTGPLPAVPLLTEATPALSYPTLVPRLAVDVQENNLPSDAPVSGVVAMPGEDEFLGPNFTTRLLSAMATPPSDAMTPLDGFPWPANEGAKGN